MTDLQANAVARLQREYDKLGWRVSTEQSGDNVIVNAYGGPRAFRSFVVTPSGGTSTQMFA